MTTIQSRPVLRICLSIEGDGSAEMHVSFQAGSFSGKSSAWFNLETLRSKFDLLGSYPLDPEEPPEIKGGYLAKNADCLAFECIYLCAKPLGVRGNIVILVRVSSLAPDQIDDKFNLSMSGYILTTYQDLKRFSDELKSLIERNLDEAVLFQTSL